MKKTPTQAPITVLAHFYDALLAGDSDSLQSLFTAEPQLNTPLQGEIKGPAALKQFVGQQQGWLRDREARSDLVNTIVSEQANWSQLCWGTSLPNQPWPNTPSRFGRKQSLH